MVPELLSLSSVFMPGSSFGQDDACDALAPPCCPCCSPPQLSEGGSCMLLPNLGKTHCLGIFIMQFVMEGKEEKVKMVLVLRAVLVASLYPGAGAMWVLHQLFIIM